MKIKSTAILLILLSAQVSFGQKIKYKDLFPILDSKNWSDGGPQLRTFLSDPKNAEAANAHLQMGLMLEDRFLKMDAGMDTTSVYNAGDSAIFYLGKAKELITAKELKKNDKYYQAFFRRDLRTGDFGIKESDVHLDIEKKIEGIESRMNTSRELNQKVKTVEDGKKKTGDSYQQLASKFATYNGLLLGADEEANALLVQLKMDAAAVKAAAEEVKSVAQGLRTKRFESDIVYKPISEFGKDGMTDADLSGGTIELWDYEDWAITTTSEINGSVGIMKSMVLSYSKSIREKKSLVKKSQDAEVDTISAELIDLFEKYDPTSVAKKLLLAEAQEVRILRQIDYSINKALLDSTLVGEQLAIYTSVKKGAEEMLVLLGSINPSELVDAKKTYADYMDSFFQSHATAGNYVTELRTWANQQKKWSSDAVTFWTERNRWGIVAVEGEEEKKVPLYVQDTPESDFFTMGMPIKSNQEIVVYGTNISEKKGFVFGFDEARVSKWMLEYDLPGEDGFKYLTDTLVAPQGSTNFFLLNEAIQENNLAIVSYSNAGALNWNAVVTVTKTPVAYKYDGITQELTILLYPEEELPLDNGEVGYLVIDKEGNAR